jgi:hypothetical protein
MVVEAEALRPLFIFQPWKKSRQYILYPSVPSRNSQKLQSSR